MGYIIAAIVTVLVGLIGWLAYEEDRAWAAFKVEHHCAKVGETSASNAIGYGLTTSGQFGTVVTYTPGKTGFKCDDGVTYWK